jgi:hypothetical protein
VLGVVSIGERRAGRPRWEEVAELVVWLAIFVLAAVTPARDDAGRANAPFMGLLESKTGGGLCVWKRVTGVPCPGCGLTRGVVQTVHAHPIEAAKLHPLAPFVTLWMAWRAIEVGGLVLLRRRIENKIPWSVSWKLYGLALLVYLAVGVWRVYAHFSGIGDSI